MSKFSSRLKQNTNDSALVDPSKSILESAIYTLFKIDLVSLIANKAILCKDPFCLQPSEIDKMRYWEYETFMDVVNKRIKEENKQNEEQQKQYGSMNPKSMMSQAQKSMPKVSMPKMPSVPKF